MSGLLLTGCEIDGVPGRDVRVRNGVVTEVGPNLAATVTTRRRRGWRAPARPARSPPASDGDGRGARVDPVRTAGRPRSRRTRFSPRGASRAAPAGASLRGVGYHESVAGALDCDVLDALVADRPVRVQHRSGGLWVLNRAALRVTGLEGDAPSGRLRRADRMLGARVPRVALDLAEIGRRLAAVGVTGVTDATPEIDGRELDVLVAAVARDDLPQRLVCSARRSCRSRVTRG